MPLKNLSNLSEGETAVIEQFSAEFTLQSRLVEMGLLPGVSIRILKKAPFRGPIELKIRNYEVSIRYLDAEQILVQLIKVQ